MKQIKQKADSPKSRFAKESISPAVLPHARVVYQQCTERDAQKPKPWKLTQGFIELSPLGTEHDLTAAVSVSNQRSVTVHFNCSRRQWPNDPFPFEIFLFHVHRLCYDVSYCVNPKLFNNLGSSEVRGMTSVRTGVVFFSVIAFVGNSSIRAAISILFLMRLVSHNYLRFTHADIFSVVTV